jgi:hypothetical protein
MPSFFIEGSIAPEQIELWDGSEWSPLLGVSMEELFEAIEQGLIVEEDEDCPGSWVYYDAQVLLPPEFGP